MLTKPNYFNRYSTKFNIKPLLENAVTSPLFIVCSVLILVGSWNMVHTGFVANGDVWPEEFVNGNQLLQKTLNIWGTDVTPLGSPQFLTASFAWTLVAHVFAFFGIQSYAANSCFLILLFAFEGLGICYFVQKLFPEYPLASIIAGIALPLSLYNAMVFINPIQAFAVGYFPFFAGLCVSTLSRARSPLYAGSQLGLASLGVIILSGTPPLAVFFVVWAVIWVLLAGIAFRNWIRILSSLLVTVAFALSMQAWWIFAATKTIFSSGGSVQQNFAGPLAWAWVNELASLPHLLAMTGLWYSNQPAYVPWITIYQGSSLRWSGLIPVILSLCSIALFRRIKGRIGLLFIIVIMSLFFAKGTHAPLSALNTWMYSHVPYFWLFRDPQMEFDIPLYVGIFTLASLSVAAGLSYVNRKFVRGRYRIIPAIVGFVLVGALLANGVVFFRGTIFKTSSTNKVSIVNKIPEYWYAAANYINSHDTSQSTVMVLPNDDYYQMAYTWGYYGVDSIPETLIHQPVLRLMPHSNTYLAGSIEYQNTLQQLQDDIAYKPSQDVVPLLRRLGVGWLIQRNDIDTSLPNREILSKQYINGYLASQGYLHKVAAFGDLSIWRVGESPTGLVSAYNGYGEWTGSAIPAQLAASSNVPWVSSSDDNDETLNPQQESISQQAGLSSEKPITTLGSQDSATFSPQTLQITLSRLNATSLQVDFSGPSISRTGTNREFGWHKSNVLSSNTPLRRGEEVAIQVNNQMFYWRVPQSSTVFHIALGSFLLTQDTQFLSTSLWVPTSKNGFSSTTWGPVGDDNKYNSMSLTQAGISELRIHQKGVELRAMYHAAGTSITAMLDDSQDGTAILAEVGTRHVKGNAPKLALAADGNVVEQPLVAPTSDWKSQYLWYNLNKPVKSISLYAYSYGDVGTQTINQYRDPSLWVMKRVDTKLVSVDAQTISIPFGTYVANTANKPSNLLVNSNFTSGLWGPIINANNFLKITNKEAGLNAYLLPGGGIGLVAKREAAAEAQFIPDVAGQLLHVHIEARSITGGPPTIKIVDESGASIWQSNLDSSHDWQTVDTDVSVPAASNGVSIYIYAYANSSESDVQYKNVSVWKWPARTGTVVVLSVKRPVSPTSVSYKVVQPGEISVQIKQPTHLLVSKTSYSKDWIVRIAKDTSADGWRHVNVDGIENGWIVPSNYRGSVTLIYKPLLLYRKLQWTAVLAVAICMILSLIGVVRRKAKGRR